MAEGMVSGVSIGETNYTVILVENLDPSKPLKTFGLPGGVIEKRESPEEAFRREWAEEVGNEGDFGPLKGFIATKITMHGRKGTYTKYVGLVKDWGRKLRKTGVKNEVGPPIRFPLNDVVSGKVKVFKNHLLPLLYVLKVLAGDDLDGDAGDPIIRNIVLKLEFRLEHGKEMGLL